MKTTIIKISTENNDFQYIETLQRNRNKRNRAGEFVVEGVRPINQAVQNQWRVNALVYSRDRRLSTWAEGILQHTPAKAHFVLSLPLLRKLSQKEDSSELLAILAIPPDDINRIPEHENLLVIVLDRLINPGNLGTIIRSCDALGADGLIMTGHSVDLYDPETIRATTGSFFSLPVVRLPSHKDLFPWLEGLKQRLRRLQIVGTSAKAEMPIHDYDYTPPTVLLVGNESRGLSEAYRGLCDALVTIPMHDSATSLNVACATSILLYEIDRQRGSVTKG
jgi:tRNA G18 (ribose-2'-O)-methylase SpoU